MSLTGGDSGEPLKGLEDIFYNISEYNILGYRHNYTKDGEYIISGMFIPSFTCVFTGGVMDERGYCDEEKGKNQMAKVRDIAKNNPNLYLLKCAEYCYTPEEALSLKGDNMFNTPLLTEQLNRIKAQGLDKKIRKGTVYYKDSESDSKVIEFVDSPNGKVFMVEPPVTRDINGQPIKNLYVAGIDGIDFGLNDSTGQKKASEYCLVIKKRAYGMDEGGKYVCIYKDRPDRIEKAFEMTILLLEYYNAKAVLENSRIGVLKYMQSKKKQHLLFKGIKSTMTSTNRGTQYGVTPSENNIKHYLELISAYTDEYSSNIMFPQMLDELITYSYVKKKEFDIIAAMGMSELGDEEMSATSKVAQIIKKTKLEKFGYYYDDKGNKRYGIIPSAEELKPLHPDLQKFIQ